MHNRITTSPQSICAAPQPGWEPRVEFGFAEQLFVPSAMYKTDFGILLPDHGYSPDLINSKTRAKWCNTAGIVERREGRFVYWFMMTDP